MATKTTTKRVFVSLWMLGAAACAQTAGDTAVPQAASEGTKPRMSEQEAKALVQPFYDFLGGDATKEDVLPAYHDDWRSYYDNEGSRTMEDTMGFVSGPLAEMVPDLNWRIVDVYVTADNDIIVRGEATGTPAGDSFMGTPLAGGKSFKFMSIDIHELEGDKIKATYHVEDWMGAVRQVAATP